MFMFVTSSCDVWPIASARVACNAYCMSIEQLTFTLGDRLRKAREVAGISSAEMAEHLGVHRNTIGNFEHDHQEPKLAYIRAWASVTGAPLTWLLDLDPNNHGFHDPIPSYRKAGRRLATGAATVAAPATDRATAA